MANYTIKNISQILKSISDPTRIRILNLLSQKSLCVCEIVEIIKLAPSTVSKHLSLMSMASILDSEKKGKWVYYRINKAKSIHYSIAKSIISFLESDEQIKKDMQKLGQLKEKNLCN